MHTLQRLRPIVKAKHGGLLTQVRETVNVGGSFRVLVSQIDDFPVKNYEGKVGEHIDQVPHRVDCNRLIFQIKLPDVPHHLGKLTRFLDEELVAQYILEMLVVKFEQIHVVEMTYLSY